jgi:hypothetical protein
MILNNIQEQYAIKLGGEIVSKHSSHIEAQYSLIALKTTNPLYEAANITIITADGKELLLG